ncbi:hypothetical protein HK100_004715 [Physocladia obscura]|uniref:Uncharacterized protein n=1 Tax=Physocladia obscura TaxID=109957 RepID=A0AAD5XDP4_9FUNG|nr:hypothetical protein HK100_004715 [Physocladia obscura]
MGDLVAIECPVVHSNGSLSVTEYESLHCADASIVLQCVWPMDESMYNTILATISLRASYTCRVPISKDATIFFPLTFSFWAKFEPTAKGQHHVHLMTHWNFLFHAVDGFFLGGTVYPLRDRWVLIEGARATVMIHGPVRWFAGHTFEGTVQDNAAWVLGEHRAIPLQSSYSSSSGSSVNSGQSVPGVNEENLKKPAPPTRPIIGASKKRITGNIAPVKDKDMPTVSKLLTAVPRSIVWLYVALSIGITIAIAALIYYAYLKPKLLLEKKQQ